MRQFNKQQQVIKEFKRSRQQAEMILKYSAKGLYAIVENPKQEREKPQLKKEKQIEEMNAKELIALIEKTDDKDLLLELSMNELKTVSDKAEAKLLQLTK